jgi:hypothetical protein
VQLKKELDFWSGTRGGQKICTESLSISKEKLSICSANEMKILLNCPKNLLDQYSLQGNDLTRACQRWLQDRQLGPPPHILASFNLIFPTLLCIVDLSLYTATASPSLLYEYELTSRILSSFAKETHATPLFLLLLRDPIQRTISLYNHWYLQELHTGNGYSLPLEQLLELELNLLSLPYPQSLLQSIYSSLLNRTFLSSFFISHEKLIQYMTKSLAELSRKSNGRLNLRSFGLVLDAWYLPQVVGWTRSNHLNLKRKLLILQSEYFLPHRLEILQSIILPWLFPHDPTLLQSLQQLIRTADSSLLPQIKNQKKEKSQAAMVSEAMRRRLDEFYNGVVPVEEFLYELQLRGYAKIVPKIQRRDQGREGKNGKRREGRGKKKAVAEEDTGAGTTAVERWWSQR